MWVRTYFAVKTAEGKDTPAQRRKLGTSLYGFMTLPRAIRYMPPGGYVEERYCNGVQDWGGRIVHR